MSIKGNIPDIGKAYIMEVGKRLEKETEERKNADNALKGALEDEKAARKKGDSALKEAIDAEAAARKEGDSALEDAIEAEKKAREKGDSALQNAIEAEAGSRKEGDDKLKEEFREALKEFGDSVIVDLVIQRSLWEKSGDINIASVPLPEAKANRLPITVVWEESFDTVKKADMSTVSESRDGMIIFKAKNIPEKDIFTTVALLYPKEALEGI